MAFARSNKIYRGGGSVEVASDGTITARPASVKPFRVISGFKSGGATTQAEGTFLSVRSTNYDGDVTPGDTLVLEVDEYSDNIWWGSGFTHAHLAGMAQAFYAGTDPENPGRYLGEIVFTAIGSPEEAAGQIQFSPVDSGGIERNTLVIRGALIKFFSDLNDLVPQQTLPAAGVVTADDIRALLIAYGLARPA